jgi:hypothetical protein
MTNGQATVSTWLFSLAYLIATVRNGPRIKYWVAHFSTIANVLGRILGLAVLFAAFWTFQFEDIEFNRVKLDGKIEKKKTNQFQGISFDLASVSALLLSDIK